MPIKALFRNESLRAFVSHVFTKPSVRTDFIATLPTSARERVNPDWLPKGEAELNAALQARKSVRVAYSEAQS